MQNDDDTTPEKVAPGPVEQDIIDELARQESRSKKTKWVRFTLAALSAIPWVGSVIAAGAALQAEQEQGLVNELQQAWLQVHSDKIKNLEETLAYIVKTAEKEGEEAEARLEEQDYLKLVEQGFRVWDEVPSESKRQSVRRVLANAAVSKLCTDDLVRLFLTWITVYDDVHFKVIAALHHEHGLSQADIWEIIDGRKVADSSSDADLFKLIFRDLSMGGVLRQVRETDGQGKFKRQPRGPNKSSSYLDSPFENDKPYELTQLGHLFVGYALDEPTTALGSGS